MRKPRRLRTDGQTVMFVAVDGKLAGLLGVADPIKATTPEAIRQLHAESIRDRDADRRQQNDGRRRSPASWASTRWMAEVLPER